MAGQKFGHTYWSQLVISLCETFRRQAGNVWNHMRKAANLQLFMNEETITETALYEIALKHQSGNFIVIPATKSEEAKHGADWLWWFVNGGKGISYRIQAKRLFPSGKYESLFKSGKDKNGNPIDPEKQLKKLVIKANKYNHIPLYCFYNFDHIAGDFQNRRHTCKHDYRVPSYWGCSLALPQDVQLSKSDALSTLRDFMVPWHLLVCDAEAAGLAKSAASAGKILAAPKLARDENGIAAKVIRPERDISFGLRDVPASIGKMLEIRRELSPQNSRRQIENRAREICEEEGVTGLSIFGDMRN